MKLLPSSRIAAARGVRAQVRLAVQPPLAVSAGQQRAGPRAPVETGHLLEPRALGVRLVARLATRALAVQAVELRAPVALRVLEAWAAAQVVWPLAVLRAPLERLERLERAVPAAWWVHRILWSSSGAGPHCS